MNKPTKGEAIACGILAVMFLLAVIIFPHNTDEWEYEESPDWVVVAEVAVAAQHTRASFTLPPITVPRDLPPPVDPYEYADVNSVDSDAVMEGCVEDEVVIEMHEAPLAEMYDPGLEGLVAQGATVTSLGRYYVVGYDPWCSHCVGKTVPNGVTASGTIATINRTVAMHRDMPFGTEVYVTGLGLFTVEDRGVGRGVVDVAVGSHAEAYAITSRRDVYIVERNTG